MACLTSLLKMIGVDDISRYMRYHIDHSKALKLLAELGNENRVVSKLTLVELASVSTRARSDEPITLDIYAIRRVGAEVIDIDFNEVLDRALLGIHA